MNNYQPSVVNRQLPIIKQQSQSINHQSPITFHQSLSNNHQSSWYQIMAQMLFGRLWLLNEDLGPSIGAIDIIFRAGSVPTGLGVWGLGRGALHWKFRGRGGPGEAPLPSGGRRAKTGHPQRCLGSRAGVMTLRLTQRLLGPLAFGQMAPGPLGLWALGPIGPCSRGSRGPLVPLA